MKLCGVTFSGAFKKYIYNIIILGSGEVVKSSTVVLTTGTFLRGVINIGR